RRPRARLRDRPVRGSAARRRAARPRPALARRRRRDPRALRQDRRRALLTASGEARWTTFVLIQHKRCPAADARLGGEPFRATGGRLARLDAMAPDRDAILVALERVIDPELKRPVTDLDM